MYENKFLVQFKIQWRIVRIEEKSKNSGVKKSTTIDLNIGYITSKKIFQKRKIFVFKKGTYFTLIQAKLNDFFLIALIYRLCKQLQAARRLRNSIIVVFSLADSLRAIVHLWAFSVFFLSIIYNLKLWWALFACAYPYFKRTFELLWAHITAFTYIREFSMSKPYPSFRRLLSASCKSSLKGRKLSYFGLAY